MNISLLSLMLTAGFYDESGEWSYTAGLPAKTGQTGHAQGFSPSLKENRYFAVNCTRQAS